MSTDREVIQQIANIANTQLGGTGGSSGGGTPTASAASVTTKPSPFTDVGIGNQDPREIAMAPGMVAGVAFTMKPARRTSAG